ncbi:MAG: hypothetical protein JSS49_05410 [Planctomycetes bacterium]|nr:hypothetical protein [Planctomycetota bacterium]
MAPRAGDTDDRKIDRWLSRLEKYGLSLGLLVMLLFWLAPKLDRLFDYHVEFLQQTGRTQAKQAETQAIGVKVMQDMDKKVDQTHLMVRDIHSKLSAPPGPQVGAVETSE